MLKSILNRNFVLACNAWLSCGQSRTPARTVFIRDVVKHYERLSKWYINLKYSDQQKRKFNSYYEQKFIKFYYKYLFHTGNIKDRLLDCFDDFEYAFSLSQSPGVPVNSKNYWQKMWSELLAKPIQSDYRPMYFSFQNTIHRKHFNGLPYVCLIEKYDCLTIMLNICYKVLWNEFILWFQHDFFAFVLTSRIKTVRAGGRDCPQDNPLCKRAICFD